MSQSMQERWDQHFSGVGAAVPRPLAQQAATEQPGGSDMASRWARWYTGQNRDGTQNSWNTPFMQEMFRQQKEAQEAGTWQTLPLSDKFTGIVTYDIGDRRFGDVYENGQRQGNVYSAYGDDIADTLMADLTLNDDEKANAFARGNLREAVMRRRQETERETRAFRSAQEFEGEATERAEDWLENPAVAAGTVAAGAGGGAAVGAGIGAAIGTFILPAVGTAVLGGVGAGIGALVGGVGAWLNRDELTTQAARAQLQQEMANERFGAGAGFTQGLQGWSGVAGKALTPASNLLHGWYDEAQGDGGDAVSEWYAVDEETYERKRSGWFTAADVSLGVLDAMGQFSNPVGQVSFMATMSGTIIGKAGTAGFTGGQAFNDRSGEYESFVRNEDGSYDVGSLLAGIGDIGIDAVQLGMGRGLMNKATNEARQLAQIPGALPNQWALRTAEARGPNAWQALARKVDSAAMRMSPGATRAQTASTEQVGAFRYALNEQGEVIGRRATMSVLAPSEALQAITAGAMARRAAAMAKKNAVAADDYYRAANQLAMGDSRWKSALVNGFGEGGEELLQGIFEPMMFDETADPYQLFEQFMYGTAMGVGMSLGAGARGVGAEDRQFAQAAVVRRAMTGAELTRDEWNGMTSIQKRAATVAPEALTRMAQAAATEVQRSMGRKWVATAAGIERLHAAVERKMLQEMGAMTVRTDGAFVITQHPDVELQPSHAVTSSFETALANLRQHRRGLDVTQEFTGAKTPEAEVEMRQRAARVAEQLDLLLGELDAIAAGFRQAMLANDRPGAEQLVQQANALIRSWYERTQTNVPADVADLRARAVSLLFIRDPQEGANSYAMLMPQIDMQLTAVRANNVLQVGHAILKPLGGDYDGDKIRQQAQLVLNDDSFVNLRTGMNRLGAGGPEATAVNMDTYPYTKWEIEALARLSRSGTDEQKALAKGAVDRMRDAILARYSTVIPRQQLIESLNIFTGALLSGDAGARDVLLSLMADRHANALAVYGREHLTDEWLWIDHVVQRELQRFQRSTAGLVDVRGEIRVGEPETASEYYDVQRRVRAERAVTNAMTLGLRGSANTLFRLFQQLHYSSFNAAVEGANRGGNIEELAQLTSLYEELSQRMTDTELALLEAKDEIAAKLLFQLKTLAEAAVAESKAPALMSLPAIAMTRMFDRYVEGGQERVYVGTTAQVLLRRILAQDKVDKATIVSPELERRWARLERMLQPDGAADALIEGLGAVPLYQLVGEAADVLGGDITLEQAVRLAYPMGEVQKQNRKRQLQLQPEYLGRKETRNSPYGLDELGKGEVTGFHAIADAIIEAGNRRISVDDTGLSTGDLGDAKGGRSYRVTEALREGFTNAREILRLYGGLKGKDLQDPAAIHKAMAEIQDLDRAVLDMIPDAAIPAVQELVNGERHYASWVYDMLAMDPDQAIMHYWRSVLLSTWTAQGVSKVDETEDGTAARAYDTLTSRMHRLMYRLAKFPDGGIRLAKFTAELGQAQNINAFMRFVNNELRDGEAPYTAWIDDASEFDADKTGGGLSQISDGTEQREAILDFRDRSKRLLTAVQTELAILDADTNTVMALRHALNDDGTVKPDAPDSARKMVRQLEEAIKFAEERLTALGPNSMQFEVAGAVIGFFGQAHIKGGSPKPFIAPGQVQAHGNSFRYATGFEQYQSALHTQDIEDVAGDMALLARDGLRIMDDEGRQIEWQPLDKKTLLDLWVGRPESRAAIRAMLFPSTWERTPDGRLVQQYLVGESLTDLLKKNPYKEMFRPNRAGRMLYASTVDSMTSTPAGNFGLLRMVNDLTIARLSRFEYVPDEREIGRLVGQAFDHLVPVVQMVGELLAMGSSTKKDDVRADLAALRTALIESRRRARIASILGVENPDELVLTELAIDAAFADYKLARLNAASTDKEIDAATEEIELTARRLKVLRASDPFRQAKDLFELHEKMPADLRAARKQEVQRYVLENPSLLTKAAWAEEPIQRLRKLQGEKNALLDDHDVLMLHANAAENEKLWDQLSNAVIATYLDDLASFTSDDVTVPLYAGASDERASRSYDPTFVFLVEDLFDPDSAIAQAAKKLHLQVGRGRRLGASVKKLAELIERTVLDEKLLGPWTSDIPFQINGTAARLDAAAAGEAIAMSGLAVVRQAVINAATRRTYTQKPPESAFSTVTLSRDLLAGPPHLEVPFDLTRADGTVQKSTMPVVALNGRFAKNVVVTYTDASGRTVVEDQLWNRGGPVPELGRLFAANESVMNSGYRTITPQHIDTFLNHVIPADVDPGNVQITIEFLHPSSRPQTAEQANNVYYEGAVHEMIADQHPSVIGGLWFTDGGVSPLAQAQALKSQKGGTRAIKFFEVPKSTSKDGWKQLEADWEADLAKVIQAKALAPIIHDTGVGRIKPQFYNALYKGELLRHFVRGFRTEGGQLALVDGKPVVDIWPAEKVIEFQLANPGAPLPLQKAQLLVPSEKVLRRMLGEQVGQAARGPITETLEADTTKVPVWTGDTEVLRARVPAMFRFDPQTLEFEMFDFFTSRAAGLMMQGRHRTAPAMDPPMVTSYTRAIQVADQRRSQIYDARRREYKGSNDRAGLRKDEIDTIIAAFDVPSNSIDLRAMGLPFFPAPAGVESTLSQKLLHEIKGALQLSRSQAMWMYRHGAEDAKANLASGVISPVHVNDGSEGYTPPPAHLQVAPDDVVIFDLGALEANTEFENRHKAAHTALNFFMGRRATIVLPQGETGGDLRAELAEYLLESGYVSLGGSNHIFVPSTEGDRYQNQRARSTTLMESRPVHAESFIVNYLVRDKAIAENAAVLATNRRKRGIARMVDLLPVNAFGSYNVPNSPKNVALVKAQVQSLLEDPRHLFTLLKIEAGSTGATQLIDDLRRTVDNWAENSVLPRQGAPFGRGYIIPLLSAQGELLLYRHGHKPPTQRELAEQLATPTGEREAGGNVAIYSSSTNKSHTWHNGVIRKVQLHSQYGLMAWVDTDLQDFGDKVQIEGSGMKYLLTTLSNVMLKLPGHQMFKHWGIDLISSWQDAQSKESRVGLVNNFRNAFMAFGVDFVPDLVEAFYSVTWSTLDETQRADYANRLNETLSWFESSLPKHRPETVQSLMRAGSLRGTLAADVAFITDKALTDNMPLPKDWDARLFGSQATPQQAIASAVILYLMAPGARAADVIGSNGLSVNEDMRTSSRPTHLMPPLFTNYFDNAPYGSALRAHLFKKLNARIDNPKARGGKRQTGYFLREDWTFVAVNDKSEDTLEGYLQFAEAHPAGDNPVLSAMAAERNTRQKVSPHAMDIAYQSITADTVYQGELTKTRRFVTGEGIDRIGKEGSLFAALRNVPTEQDYSFLPWKHPNPAEVHYKQLAREAVGLYRRPLNKTTWSKDEKNAYEQLTLDAMRVYGLKESQADLVDGWIRQQLGIAWGEEGEDTRISGTAAIQIAKDIIDLGQNGFLPTHGGEVPQLHYFDLSLLYRAYEKNGTFVPVVDAGIRKRKSDDETIRTTETAKARTWEDWVLVALGIADTQHGEFDRMYLLELDGFMHTYLDADPRLGGLPVSRDVLVAQDLLDPNTSRMVLSLDPDTDVISAEDPLRAVGATSLAEIMGAQRRNGVYVAKHAPVSERARQLAKRRRWRAEHDIPVPAMRTLKNFRELGADFVHDATSSNAFLRVLTNMRLTSALLNPLLYISAGPEMWVRSVLEDATNLLTGDSTGVATRAAGRLGVQFRYTPEQLTRFRNLTIALGGRAEFKAMLYRDLFYQQSKVQGGAIEKFTARMAKVGSRLQDPTWGMRGDALARRYLETVLREIAAMPGEQQSVLSPEFLVAQLNRDPEWIARNHPAVHNAALATIANVRSLKPTVASLTLRGVYEPLSQNPNLFVATTSTLILKLPLLFSTYALNVTHTLLGLQGANNALAMFLDGRKKGFIGRIQAVMGGGKLENDDTFDMSTTIEGVDLAKSFIQAGLTHTSLFAMGLMAGGLGLSGEDEEDRRRRRAAAYQGAGYVYDPRELENDFRNADAVYLDWLPFGFSSMFKTGGDEDTRAMANLHWILRQFISPIIGMERFYETGNSQHLIWGFQDALGAFPLINTGTWTDAVQTFALLDRASKTAESVDDPGASAAAYSFALNQVMALEKMLLENSFVNSIYVSMDAYDRDPFQIPLLSGTGEIQRDKLNQPRPTTALENYQTEEGLTEQGYVGRQGMGAQMHAYTENRLGLALMMSLFTGQPDLDSQYFRYNMVPKTRTIKKYDLTQEEAEGLVLSVWDAETGIETLTESGARAVVQGLWQGTVAFNSPSLEGIYISREMREEIAAKWMSELIQEGIDLGLDQYDAERRMKELWFGPTTDPTVPGLNEYLFSDQISYSPNLRYYQLNTTYVTGPDGRPWATGVQRDGALGLLNAFGLLTPGFTRYYSGADGDLPQDGRLNSIDEAAGINTGMRALQKTDESWMTPTDEEIAESLEKALRQATSQRYVPSSYSPYGYGGYGRRGGYGRGGGGGGGSFTRLQTPVRNDVPYGQSIPFLNTSTPIIRRSSIRRTRFSSERGRLNQWQ